MDPLTLSGVTCMCARRPGVEAPPKVAECLDEASAPGGPSGVAERASSVRAGTTRAGGPAPPLQRATGANFQKTRRRPQPRPVTVGGGGGAGAPGPVAPPPPAAARAAHLPPAGRRCSGNAPQPGRGPRPAQLAPHRESRSSDGQHGAPDPARYARSRAPKWRGAPGPPRVVAAAEPGCKPEPEPRSRTPAGMYRPFLVFLALAVRPTPLFQPEVANERARGRYRGFPRPEPFRGPAGCGCPGYPRTACRRPRHTCYFLAAFPRAPGCAPFGCPFCWGSSQPHLSHCCGAHRPLVKSALEFPRPEKGGGRGAWGGCAAAGGRHASLKIPSDGGTCQCAEAVTACLQRIVLLRKGTLILHKKFKLRTGEMTR